MGINRAALIAESEFMDLPKIQHDLALKLKESRRATWEDAKLEAFFSEELMLVQRGNKHLLYFDIDFFQEHYSMLRNLAQDAHRAMLFIGSETSMNFSFEWFKYRYPEARDDYDLASSFQVEGNNRLGLSEECDVFFDGFFPYLEKELSLSNEDVCVYYNFQTARYKEDYTSSINLVDQDKAISSLLNRKQVLNGLQSLERLRDFYYKKREAGFPIPSSSLKLNLSDRALRKKIHQCSKSWENGEGTEAHLVERKAVALLWATRDIDLTDLYAGDYKGNWWAHIGIHI
ncbi:MAG: hypothetical protein NXI09_10770 [Bacteroidetes bacterium]|nr:hypothetical protein [Bacteroidota bacterium]